MSLISLRGVHRYYGAEHILGPVDLDVHESDRIGLIGPNGSGKSTLLDILAGKEPDEGDVTWSKGIRIGYLQQEVLGEDELTLLEYALTAFAHLDEVEQRLKALEARMADPAVQSDEAALQSTVATYQRLMAQLEEEGGFQKEARAKGVLFGLGFSQAELEQVVGTLSGGEKARAQLARVLLGSPDILILDEPTNHLDIEAVEWLQAFLSRYAKAIVLVSHDRYLLQAVATKIWEIEEKNVVVYNGGYDASRRMAAERAERMAKLYEADQEERARLEAFIRKYKAGNRSTQAKSREKRLEKLPEAPPPPKEARRVRFTVPIGRRSERRVCTLEDVTLGYGQTVLLRELNLEITRGERIGIAGPNGSGKSTLLRCIAQEAQPKEGRVDRGRGVVTAYYSQIRTDLAPDQSVLEAVLGAKDQLLEEARSFLARFLFRGDDVFKQVSTLSGGEKSRLALARLLLLGGNFLLLDEPTNHLDIGMREALEEALEKYEGTLVFVTHDRRLLDALAERIWWIEDGELHVIDGGYRELTSWLGARRTAKDEALLSEREKSTKRGLEREDRGAARSRARQRERERQLASVEAEVERLTARKAELEEALSDPATYEDPARAAELSREHAEVVEGLQAQETLWIELAEEVEGEQ